MADFDYDSLKSEYGNFAYPVASITVNGNDISENKADLAISDIEVEMTSGFEAAIATFWIYNCYNKVTCEFEFDDLKKYICLGSSVVIALGYGESAREIFRGFISRVNFAFREGDMPGVEITAMDVKGIMMAGNYSRQLTATSYSEAVEEILKKTAYSKLQSNNVITELSIEDTPDKQQSGGTSQDDKASDKTIEMVSESDYEFVVKAAKKFNYEFFTIGGALYFRKAKGNTDILMELAPGNGLRSYEISYDITGLVETIEVRGMDAGKGKQITTSTKLSNTISNGSRAKSLLSGSQKVYIDPTISSKEEAGYRAEYLAEDISYRLGTLEAEFIGMPELTPGRFLKIKGLGTAASNTFYLYSVRHILKTSGDGSYVTRVTGKAASMQKATST